MALISFDFNPSTKHLRSFGVIALCMLNAIGMLLLWRGRLPLKGFAVFCMLGLVIFVLSRISTALVKPIYQAMILASFPIGWVVSHLFIGLFYYVIITGISLIFRLLGRDPLCRKYDSQAETYWIPHKRNRSTKEYFHQF
jgi:hypothetical protein